MKTIEDLVCSITQMETLKALGFDLSKAKWVWFKWGIFNTQTVAQLDKDFDSLYPNCGLKIPTYSEVDMMEILPQKIDSDYSLFILQLNGVWNISYRYYGLNNYPMEIYMHSSESLRDALFSELLILKHENKI